jgi:hypothetical protein
VNPSKKHSKSTARTLHVGAAKQYVFVTDLRLVRQRQTGYTHFGNYAYFPETESHSVIRLLNRVLLPCAVVASMFFAASMAGAEPQTSAPAEASVNLELNKLEPVDKGCRAYVVVNNTGDTSYQSFKVDLVLFQTDGVIGKRFSIDLAPLHPKKKTVKLFDIDGMSCDKIGSLLINDVMECKSDTGASDSCLQNLTTSTLTKVQLSK